jgi:hypothetical protein
MRLGLYTLVGLPSVIAGIMLLLGGPQSHYAAFAGALVAGGSALVWLGVSGRRIGRAGWLACGALAIAGLFGSLLVVREEVACMYCYHRGQGYPWGWLDSGFTHSDMPTLQRAHQIMAANPEVASRAVDWMKVLVNGVFWGFVALPLAVAATQVSRMLRPARRVVRSARS